MSRHLTRVFLEAIISGCIGWFIFNSARLFMFAVENRSIEDAALGLIALWCGIVATAGFLAVILLRRK